MTVTAKKEKQTHVIHGSGVAAFQKGKIEAPPVTTHLTEQTKGQ
jgi:hypothetical protein